MQNEWSLTPVVSDIFGPVSADLVNNLNDTIFSATGVRRDRNNVCHILQTSHDEKCM